LGEAEEMIKKALEIEPENGAYWDSLGWVHYKQGEYMQALEEIKKALKYEEDDPVIKEHLGEIYYKLGNKSQALKLWEELLKQGFEGEHKDLREKVKQLKEEIGD